MVSPRAKDFDAVFCEELEVLDRPAGEKNLTGLAFSGGGIRSATFNLGIIQSLARKNLLEKFDYLSTVSGGGYIGSWLSVQIHRHSGEGDVTDWAAASSKISGFQHALRTSLESGSEHDAVKWLRSYSNYLTPRKGLTGDTLSAIGTWLRNTLLNQTVLLLFFVTAILLPQVSVLTLHDFGWLYPLNSGSWLAISTGLIFLAILFCAVSLPRLRCCDGRRRAAGMAGQEPQLAWLIIPMAVLAAYSLSLWMYSTSVYTSKWLDSPLEPSLNLLPRLWDEYPLLGGPESASLFVAIPAASFSSTLIAGMWSVIYVLPWIAYLLYSLLTPGPAGCGHPAEQRVANPAWHASVTILSALVAGAFGGWLMYLLSNAIARQDEPMRLWWATGFGTPLLLVIFCLVLVLHQGLMARLFRVSQMEWWARVGGYVLFIAAAWAGMHALLVYAPPLIDMLKKESIAAGGVAWAAHSLAGVVLGRSAGTSGLDSALWKERLTRSAPYVFVLGYLVAISWAVHALMHGFGTAGTPQSLHLAATAAPFSSHLQHALQINSNADIAALWYVLAACGSAFIILAWRLDVNLFSIHHFYRNRLTRCYLGAGRGDKRTPNPFTGFDPCDDLKLAELKQRPLHLINTALNLVQDNHLAWQDRKAYSFTFSPVACGFQYPPNASQPGGGYCGSAQYMGGVRIGTAMAASGAAASPNMGYHSSPAVTFLLTLFNVRLGHWCPNTAAQAIKPRAIGRDSPPLGGEYLIKEMFGQTDDRSAFVYLSDGGHFENLAVYELVRRRCRYIMVVDAGQDRERTFEDMANLIRKCRIDFGVAIDIDLDALRTGKDGYSKDCYALGDITYPPHTDDGDADEDGNWGVLLYIKPSLLQGMPADILQYARTVKGFPHQSTSDQFFDEAQFESYRHLGSFLMDHVLLTVSQHKTPGDRSWNWLSTVP